jgi:hypothetical protein
MAPGRKTVDDDDVSEVGGNEFEEDPMEQPRFKFSTAELGDDSKRNTTCCLIAMGVICLAVAIVLSIVLVGFTKDKDSNDDSTSAPGDVAAGDNTSNPVPGQGLFKASKDFVESRCAKNVFEEDPTICQGTCAGFSCCDPFLPEEESCFHTNREGCIAYARCHILTAGGKDPPPTNLATICSLDSIAQDSTPCELQCLDVECCYSEENPCMATDFYACLDYSPCQNLRLDLEVPIPQLDILETLCVPGVVATFRQQEACDDECAPAECCWDPDTSCLESNFFTCLQYGPCDKLDLPPPGQAVPPPNGTIGDVCSTFNIENDPTACETACAFGDCCSESGVTNCFDVDPLGCLEYAPCKVI